MKVTQQRAFMLLNDHLGKVVTLRLQVVTGDNAYGGAPPGSLSGVLGVSGVLGHPQGKLGPVSDQTSRDLFTALYTVGDTDLSLAALESISAGKDCLVCMLADDVILTISWEDDA